MDNATTLEQVEAAPTAAYPTLTPAVPDEVWERLESYIAWRFSPRSVTWIVEGPGTWKPPLAPATISGVSIWDVTANAMVSWTLDPSPYGGYVLPACGPYQFTGTVGDASAGVPAIVQQAAQRLAAYFAAKPGTPGTSQERIEAGSIRLWRTRDPEWMAKALQNSGAADLLRTYRRV